MDPHFRKRITGRRFLAMRSPWGRCREGAGQPGREEGRTMTVTADTTVTSAATRTNPAAGSPRRPRPRPSPTSARASPSTPMLPRRLRARGGGDPGFVVLDSAPPRPGTRGTCPVRSICPPRHPQQAEQLLDRSVPVVTYCWVAATARPVPPSPSPTWLPRQGDARGLRVLGARRLRVRDLGGRRAARGGPADGSGGRRPWLLTAPRSV